MGVFDQEITVLGKKYNGFYFFWELEMCKEDDTPLCPVDIQGRLQQPANWVEDQKKRTGTKLQSFMLRDSAGTGIVRCDTQTNKKLNILKTVEVFTCKEGKKHGLLAVVKGEDKEKPNFFMLYKDNKLIESGKSLDQLYKRMLNKGR